ncbi:MAG: alpha/beta hydrolase [Nonomuraea sp.]|nr:alpha/beta hydrolase [Nonomuraea sp.]
MESTFVLVHSPSVGPATWAPIARELERRGHATVVPDLTRVTEAGPPYWPAVVEAVRAAAPERRIVLAGHSNAGLFLPVIKEGLGDRVVATAFVDAHLPPPTGLIAAAEEAFLPFLRGLADADGVLPRWTDWWSEEDVAPMFPDAATRDAVVSEQPRLPLSYYTQRLPVPAGWDRGRCGYLWFGPPYGEMADSARERGWMVLHTPGLHLHQLVDPRGVTDALLKLTGK